MGRRGALVILWGLLLSVLLSEAVDRLGLKYVQGVIWPSDLYTFQHMPLPPIDVAVLGSSRASFALPPSALDGCLSQRLQRKTTSVNLARTFATAFTAEDIARELLTDARRPKVLVLGIGPEFFNEHNHQLSASVAAHARISDLPQLLRYSRGLIDVTTALRPLVRSGESLSIFLSGRHQSEHHLRWMMLHHGGGQYCYGTQGCEISNTDLEHNLGGHWNIAVNNMLPRVQQERFSRYAVGTGLIHDRMMSLIRWSVENDVELVIVRLPLHESFLSRIPSEVILANEGYLHQLTSEHDLHVFNGNSPQWSQRRLDYIDPDHLSARAALKFSEQVCEKMLTSILRAQN